MAETSIDQTEIYRGRVIRLDVHTVQLDNGNRSMREIVTHPGAVAIVAVDEQQRVLLVRQFRFAAGRELLEIPAGTLEPGEDPMDCAARELREETGFRPLGLTSLGGIYVAPGYTTEFIHLYLCQAMKYDPLNMDDDESIELVRVPLKEVSSLILSGQIIDAKSVTALLRVLLLNA
jgi:ADP-ribose pyrophosphatase